MQIEKQKFRPNILHVVVAVALSATFIFLVLLQQEQDSQQHDRQALIEQRLQEPPLLIRDLLTDVEAVRYRRIKVRGTFEKNYGFLLNSAVGTGRAGYYVVSPLHISGTEIRVLVNRGWVPLGKDRGILPDIDVPTGEVELQGFVDIPNKRRTVLGPAKPTGESWPPLWPFLDLEKFTKSVPYPTQPFVVLEHEGSPHGYIRRWSFSISRREMP